MGGGGAVSRRIMNGLRIPEEADLDRLDEQLHDVLERHLKQLGGPVRPRRRARWDEEFGVVAPPVEARSIRR